MAQRTLGTVAARRSAAAAKAKGSRPRYDTQDKGNRWMVTLNFGEADELERMSERATIALRRLNAAAQVPPTTFAIFQPERGEENGRLHVQAYFEFEKRLTQAQVRKHVGESCWVHVADGSQEECIAYCSKEGPGGRVQGAEVTRFGEPMKLNKNGSTSGSRTDWADAWRMVKSGARTGDIIEKHPALIPNVRALQYARFVTQCERSRSEPTKLLVLWGSPDSGKTTTARSLCEEGSYFIVTADGKSMWWDGYDPDRHETVIFDEFVGSRMPLTFLNQLADVLDINVQTKGGFARFLSKRIIITSNFSPREWYAACVEARVEALFRRISTEVEFRLVDEIVDMKGDPSKTQKRLHLVVHKGHWNWALTNTRYDFDECCAQSHKRDAKQLAEQEEPPRATGEPIEVSDEVAVDTDEEVQRRKAVEYAKRRRLDPSEDFEEELARRSGAQVLGDSQEFAIDVSDGDDEEGDGDDADPGDYSDFEEWASAQAERGRPGFASTGHRFFRF